MSAAVEPVHDELRTDDQTAAFMDPHWDTAMAAVEEFLAANL